MAKALTLTIITSKASSLNYGETIGNVSVLKKVSLGDGSQITYVSDKALKYEIRRKGKEEKGWKLLDKLIKEYIQNEGRIVIKERESEEKKKKKKKIRVYDVDSLGIDLVKNFEEFDLFGGLFTKIIVNGKEVKKLKKDKISEEDIYYPEEYDSVKRTSPVKVTYAFSISKFQGDLDFMNNIDAYNRYIKHVGEAEEQRIVQTEQHTSHYYYTLTVDLDRVGVWEKEEGVEEVLSNEEKAKRVKDLLDIILNLRRQIKGRCENLSPVFVIGGVFSVKNPFFEDGILAKEVDNQLLLNVQRLKDCAELVPEGEEILCGIRSGVFANEEEIRQELNAKSVKEVFEELKKRVEEVYGVSKS